MNLDQFMSPADQDEVKQDITRHDQLVTKRKTWETHWQEIMDYIVPRKNDITVQHAPGTKRGNQLFDSTAIQANNMLAGALHSMLTSPTTQFFDLAMEDPSLEDDDAVKEWLQDTAQRLFKILNNTNFQTENHEVLIDQGALGTSCLFMGEDKTNVLHFSARSMKEIYVDENNLGLIDTVHREYKWNLRQIVQEFGEKALKGDLLTRYKAGDETPFEIIHAVRPMSDDEKKGLPFEYKSRYILKEAKFYLSKGNYHEFPYAVPRWTKTSGELYGRGPGMDMLADIRMVNKMMETVLKGAQKTVDPPLMVTDDGVIGQVRLTPGGLTVVRAFSAGDVPIKPLITDARIDFGREMVEDIRNRIRAGFYVDQLQLHQGDRMTTEEVSTRNEERLRLMGPILSRQHFEYLSPLITRAFGVGSRRGLISEPPASIVKKKFHPRYSSLVARAQRMSDGQNLGRFVQVATPFFQIDQGSAAVVKCDDAVKYIADIYGVPMKILRNKRELDDIKKAQAAAQAKAVGQMDERHQAEVAGKVMPGIAQLQTAQNKGQ